MYSSHCKQYILLRAAISSQPSQHAPDTITHCVEKTTCAS